MKPEMNLLPSHSVEITIDQGEKPPIIMRTLVERGVQNDEFRIMAPINDGRVFMFTNVDYVELVFLSGPGNVKKVYNMRCKIMSKKRIEDMPVIVLRIVSDPVEIQRRNAFRVNVINTLYYEEDGNMYDLTSKDISLTGMLAHSKRRLESGSKINIIWDHDNTDAAPIIIGANILDQRYDDEGRNYVLRMTFDELSDKESQQILTYLYKKQAEQNRKTISYNDNFSSIAGYEKSNTEQLAGFLSIITLVLLIISGALFLKGSPTGSYGIWEYRGVNAVKYWNTAVVTNSVLVAVLGFIVEIATLAIRLVLTVSKKMQLRFGHFLMLILSMTTLLYIITTLNHHGVVLGY